MRGAGWDLTLDDLIDVPMLQSMMDDFYRLTRIPMSLIGLDGTVVVGAGWQEACTHFHRVNAETCAACIESDTLLTAGIPPGEMKLYKCKNGMWDAATPILIGGRRIGNLFTGQFFFEDEDIDEEFFRDQADRCGFDELEYLAAIGSVPQLSREAVETGLAFLTKLSHMISQLAFSNRERALAQTRLQATLDTQTTLTEVLSTEHEILRAVMENTDTALVYLDYEFNFVAVNSTYASGSGHEVNDLIGKNHFDLFPNEENQAIFESSRETGQAVEYRAKPFEFADQPWRGVTYWDWRLTPVKDPDGDVQGFAFSLLDVTRPVRQRAFSESINRLNEIIHSNLDFSGILKQVVPELAEVVGCEFVGVALQSPGHEWRLSEAIGLPDSLRDRQFSGGQIPGAEEALERGRPIILTREQDAALTDGVLGELGVQSMAVVPLSVPGQPAAVAYGYLSGPGVFEDDVIDFATKISSSLSLALSNSLLFHDAMRSARLSGTLAKVDEALLSALTLDDVVAKLVEEASRAAGADRALVIRVDGHSYTITHVRGIADDLVGVSREDSFYPAFAIAATERQPVLVSDTWNDPRTNKEFVVPNNLRAFRLLPLTTQGEVTHVLALVNDEPRQFDDADRQSAQRMAAAMSLALTNAYLYERERRIADQLQDALLALPDEIPGVEFSHAYHSAADAARVGGDFYDIFDLGDSLIGITVGDVAGKGLDAAVLTSLAKNTVRAHASERGKTPAQVLTLTNDVIYGATSPESFITLFFGVLDCRSGRLTYANAGHTTAMVVSPDAKPGRLSATGTLLGAFAGVEYSELEVVIEPRSLLFLYTDGLTEARGGNGLYGEDRLSDFLAAAHVSNTSQLVEDVVIEVLSYSGGTLGDDLAILAVQRLEPAGDELS